MPGITGSASYDAGAVRDVLERALYEAPRSLRTSVEAAGFACAVRSLLPTSGVAGRDGACLAVEGHVDGEERRGGELAAWLLDRFLAEGPRFAAEFVGSFQIAVHHRGATWLFADPVASRPLFYRHGPEGLRFAPEVAPLALPGAGGTPAVPGGIDRANLVQFLVSGRFFTGGTLLAAVRQLLPGEWLAWRDGRLERGRSFRYEVHPADPRDRPELLRELAGLLDRAILGAFARAKSPVVLLSGGYDSRYLFHTVARAVADPSRLRTVLWGRRMDLPGSDNWTAERVARRYGAQHLALPWRTETLPALFDEMFRAQSGMTELVFTHSDDLAVFRSLAGEHGFDAALRADEVFGPKGEEVATVDEALAQVAMSRTGRVEGIERWFAAAGDELLAAHAEAMERLLADAPAEPAGLRDTLYGRERLPALLTHHNYPKRHFLEMMTPLLDLAVLRFWSALPAWARCDKRLFRDSYHARFGDTAEIPIATVDNGLDWAAALRETPPLAAWVRRGLAELPPPLDRDFFLGKLDEVLRGDAPAPPDPRRPFRIPAVRLVARAFVLGRWLLR